MQIFQKVKNGGMSICVSCAHRKVCKGIDNQPCVECNQFFNEDKQPQTNADRIRAMSDEELADMRIRYDPTRDMYISDRGAHYDFVSAMEEELEWLKQPVEE